MQFEKMCGKINKLQTLCFILFCNWIWDFPERGWWYMIEVTKINGVKVLINPDLLELVEETPDTVLTLTTGRKIIVKESRQEVKNLVKLYKKEIFCNI